ncbi:MAG: DNRLRE domain-containing protein [bacterium]|nr:DNRLRE domain-containing protein [bacterium]
MQPNYNVSLNVYAIVLIMILSCTNMSFAESVTLTPNVDTYVNSDAPTTAYGTAQSLVAGYWNGGTLYSYLHFNVSGIDPATITSAILTLHDAGTLLNPSMCVYRLGDAFTNSTTWNSRPAFYSATPYDCHTITPASIAFNITPLVVGWADGSFFNAGLMLRKNPDGAPNGTVAAGSAEHSVPSLRPELTIVYTCTPPAMPTISASDNRCDYVQLTWTNVADESGYEIQRNNVTIQTMSANVTSWQDIPSPGCYNYRVRALSLCGNSSWSTVDQGCLFSTPATPPNFTATDGNGQVTLTWNDVTGESGYSIQRWRYCHDTRSEYDVAHRPGRPRLLPVSYPCKWLSVQQFLVNCG